MLRAGPKVALTGGTTSNDRRLIWGKIDPVGTNYPDMVLLRGGSSKGAELIAATWAKAQGVTQLAFKPARTQHAKAAPFKRNDAVLHVLAVGVLVYPGNGTQENPADKARKLGIPVRKFEKGVGSPDVGVGAAQHFGRDAPSRQMTGHQNDAAPPAT